MKTPEKVFQYGMCTYTMPAHSTCMYVMTGMYRTYPDLVAPPLCIFSPFSPHFPLFCLKMRLVFMMRLALLKILRFPRSEVCFAAR